MALDAKFFWEVFVKRGRTAHPDRGLLLSAIAVQLIADTVTAFVRA